MSDTAIVNRDRLECSVCGGLLAKVILRNGKTDWKSRLASLGIDYDIEGWEIKCTNRVKREGKNVTCGALNKVVL